MSFFPSFFSGLFRKKNSLSSIPSGFSVSPVNKKSYPGFFITFEGVDGAGKSTQIKRLEKRLRHQSFNPVLTREPGGTLGAELVREVLFSSDLIKSLNPDIEAFLFAAARSDHIDCLIRHCLIAGNVVLCDRFLDSSRVYQAMAGSLDLQLIYAIEDVILDDIIPNLTLIFDIPTQEAIKRCKNRFHNMNLDPFESDSADVHERRRKAFLEIACREPSRCRIIDASGDEEQIANMVFDVVFPALKKHFFLSN